MKLSAQQGAHLRALVETQALRHYSQQVYSALQTGDLRAAQHYLEELRKVIDDVIALVDAALVTDSPTDEDGIDSPPDP